MSNDSMKAQLTAHSDLATVKGALAASKQGASHPEAPPTMVIPEVHADYLAGTTANAALQKAVTKPVPETHPLQPTIVMPPEVPAVAPRVKYHTLPTGIQAPPTIQPTTQIVTGPIGRRYADFGVQLVNCEMKGPFQMSGLQNVCFFSLEGLIESFRGDKGIIAEFLNWKEQQMELALQEINQAANHSSKKEAAAKWKKKIDGAAAMTHFRIWMAETAAATEDPGSADAMRKEALSAMLSVHFACLLNFAKLDKACGPPPIAPDPTPLTPEEKAEQKAIGAREGKTAAAEAARALGPDSDKLEELHRKIAQNEEFLKWLEEHGKPVSSEPDRTPEGPAQDAFGSAMQAIKTGLKVENELLKKEMERVARRHR